MYWKLSGMRIGLMMVLALLTGAQRRRAHMLVPHACNIHSSDLQSHLRMFVRIAAADVAKVEGLPTLDTPI